MFKSFKAFAAGSRFHIRGIRFGFGHFPFLILSVLPFLFTLALYIFAFYVFSEHAEDFLQMLWKGEAKETSRYVGWLYWAYIHVVKFFLYLILLIVMFYTFVVLSNIVASPVYDLVSTKYERAYHQPPSSEEQNGRGRGILTVAKEELKKALFMLFVPLLLLFIPVVGAFLSFAVAALFIAWDYVDFSLSKDYPLLKDRMKALWRFKALLFGFGCPLLIPFFGLFLMPFAILGATTLYYDTMQKGLHVRTSTSPEAPETS
jgi:CysZ protein